MENKTRYDGRTILRWVNACLRRRSNRRARQLRITVSYSKIPGCSGAAVVGGRTLLLTLPRNPAHLTAENLSFNIDYLVLMLLGNTARSMTRTQKTSWLREWARGLPLPEYHAAKEKPKVSAEEKRAAAVQRRANRAKSMLSQYETLEAAAAAELLRLGTLRKKWQEKVAYYEKQGVL